ncbi:Gfo/Idh/MocA family oxidoreductase [Flavobacteriaceae bacterium]|jgi:predicted dehydrogenase|nr:Gfo/Idh/MocA family oxidoreductase [Flavobacteriaceae bacterium]
MGTTDHSKKLNVMILGGGINSAVGSAHVSALKLSGKYNIVGGFFSRNIQINNESAKEYGLTNPRIYNDFELLCKTEKGKIDAIIILTPTDQHFQQVITCLKMGIPVICEKALVGNIKEAQKIKNLLNEKNGFLAVIYNYLGYPMIRELKNIIENGFLGKVNQVLVEMPQESFQRVNAQKNPNVPQEWRLKDGVVSTISLDLGIHLHIIVKYLTGELPLNVVSKRNSFGNFPELVDNINCLIEYSNNILCNMWYSKVALGKRNGLKVRVLGSEGYAEWVQEIPEKVLLSDCYGNNSIVDRGSINSTISNQRRYTRFKAGHPTGFIEAFANYYEDIADGLVKFLQNPKKQINTNEYFGINEAFEGISLIESISKSDSTKSWQTIVN